MMTEDVEIANLRDKEVCTSEIKHEDASPMVTVELEMPRDLKAMIELECADDQTVEEWINTLIWGELEKRDADREVTVEFPVELPGEFFRRMCMRYRASKALGSDADLDDIIHNYVRLRPQWDVVDE